MTINIIIIFLAFINSVSANGYQIVVSTSKPVLQQSVAISTIQVFYLFITSNWWFHILHYIILYFPLGTTNRVWISR